CAAPHGAGIFYGDGSAAVEWSGQAKSAGDAEQDQEMVGTVSQCDLLLFRQLQHITLCAVTQVNDGMEQGLTCSMPFLSTERSSLWDIFQKCRWICRKAANRLPPRSPASAPLRRGKALTSCRCRRLAVSLYRLLKNRRRSLLLRTMKI